MMKWLRWLLGYLEFRVLRVDAIVEPTRLFTDAAEDACNQRPDIFLRNLRGLGRQIIIEPMVNLEQATRRLSDFCKLVTIRKRLNTAESQSKIIYGLFPQLLLTLVKLMPSLKLLLESRLDTS